MFKIIGQFSKNGQIIYTLRKQSSLLTQLSKNITHQANPSKSTSHQKNKLNITKNTQYELRQCIWNIAGLWSTPKARRLPEKRQAYGITWTDSYKYILLNHIKFMLILDLKILLDGWKVEMMKYIII